MKLLKNYFLSFIFFLGMIIFFNGCCSLLPWLPWCEKDEYSFTPSPFTRLCPDHIGGDRDFDGHGPDVTASAELDLRNSNKEVWVIMKLHAKETQEDWTEAQGEWGERLWVAPQEYTIEQILSDKSSNTSYRDTDHQLDRPTVRGGSLVSKFEIMGDTDGDDVGDCTADDVYLNVFFNQVRVKVQKEQ